MSIIESRTRAEPFSDGTGKGYTLVKGAPLIPPVIACIPTFYELQMPEEAPQMMSLDGPPDFLYLTFTKNGVKKTLKMDAMMSNFNTDVMEFMTIFQNESKTGQAFISPSELPFFGAPPPGPMPMAVSTIDDGEVYEINEGPMEIPPLMITGIGTDGSTFLPPIYNTVIGNEFVYTTVEEVETSDGPLTTPVQLSLTDITEVIPETTTLTIERTPNIGNGFDLFEELIGPSEQSSVTIISCAYIKYPVFDCTPTKLTHTPYDANLDVMMAAKAKDVNDNVLIGAYIEFNGRKVVSLKLLNNFDSSWNLDSGFGFEAPISFTEGAWWKVSDVVSSEYDGLINSNEIEIWTSEFSDCELRKLAMMSSDLISDSLVWTLRGFGAQETGLMRDQILSPWVDNPLFRREANEIIITKMPPDLLTSLNPNNISIGFVDYVDVFNDGADIVIHSCNAMEIDNAAMLEPQV